MKKVHYTNLIIVFFFSLIMVVQGCSSQPKWMEYEGQFATKDFKKAQDEIPFTIIMPTYLPYSQQDESIADIQGPLKEYQGDEIEVLVAYSIKNPDSYWGLVLIREYNHPVALGEPEYNADLEYVTISKTKVIKTTEVWSDDTFYCSFNSLETYFVIESHNIAFDENYKMVTSIIEQIE